MLRLLRFFRLKWAYLASKEPRGPVGLGNKCLSSKIEVWHKKMRKNNYLMSNYFYRLASLVLAVNNGAKYLTFVWLY